MSLPSLASCCRHLSTKRDRSPAATRKRRRSEDLVCVSFGPMIPVPFFNSPWIWKITVYLLLRLGRLTPSFSRKTAFTPRLSFAFAELFSRPCRKSSLSVAMDISIRGALTVRHSISFAQFVMAATVHQSSPRLLDHLLTPQPGSSIHATVTIIAVSATRSSNHHGPVPDYGNP